VAKSVRDGVKEKLSPASKLVAKELNTIIINNRTDI
jgi:hypothetical protein